MDIRSAIRAFTLFIALSDVLTAAGLEGRITADQGGLPRILSVQVYSEGRFVDTIHVDDDGSFTVRNLSPGNYEFRVVDMHGNPIRTHHATLATGFGAFEIRVPGLRQENAPSGTVSVKALATKVPREVNKAMAESDKALKRGDMEASIAHLRRAVGVCGDCAQVHNNLGARYMRMGALADARQAFGRAVDLDPDSAVVQANLALALVSLKDFSAAEAHARKALSLDAACVPARYVLGLVAIGTRNCTNEAVAHLRVAAESYPRAQLSLAQAHVCRGENKAAADVLRAYLSNPNAEARNRVEQWRSEISAGLP